MQDFWKKTRFLATRADRTIAVFEQPGEIVPVPAFAESFSLTVGEMFRWLTE